MKLSTRGDYAVRAVLELAELPAGESLSLHELADRAGVPGKYLEQIVMPLRGAGILGARRGSHGGYVLARPAADLTVGEVVRVMDGPLAPIACASRTAYRACPPSRCVDEANCVLRGLWTEVRDAVAEIMDHTTFADLAERAHEERGLRRLMYHI